MAEVSAFDAKTHFSQLLARARGGEEITITHRGKPVARLVPIRDEAAVAMAHVAADRLREIAARIPGPRITPEEIKSWIDEGRR
ncbi:type II toxin-antitoxin system Phd/YefM family antitoxin [Microbaculum sp. FT89]|uniref:type II toxin-antitoxin system Phd/YefM family antitoxin n=1 Tax=Microbaculum sp. FT89 TaxID=3447298 RepID=UPI003F53E05B